jgi:hypothetical protein
MPEQISFDFKSGWLSPGQLKTGHYGIGRTAWGTVVDVYCIAPGVVANVATGERVTITGWKTRCKLKFLACPPCFG